MYGEAARLYDAIHDARGRDPDSEADALIHEIRQRAPEARTLLDIACGTGANMPRFGETFEVTGLDASSDMLAIASQRCPDALLVEADMRSFDLGRSFDAIVSIFSGIGYLIEESDLRQAVTAMSSHLRPGGVLALEGWIEPDEWLGASVSTDSCQTDEFALARVTTSDAEGMRSWFTTRYVVATLEGITSVDEHHVLRLSDPEEFATAYQQAGLTFERLPSFLRPGRGLYIGTASA
jgi:SAM-dependent methyltransferase